MAFGLAPQVVAQDSSIIYADSDSYEVIIDVPQDGQFRSLRDLGETVPAEPVEQAPLNQQAGLPLPVVPQDQLPTARPITTPQSGFGTAPAVGTNVLDLPINALPSIADLVDQVSPSVVNIVVTTDTGETTSEGQGSGFIISKELEVVTNYHVIEGGTHITIESVSYTHLTLPTTPYV